MDSYELSCRVEELVSEFLEDFTEVTAEQCGLDRRSAWGGLYVSESEGLVCNKEVQKTLEYYGGFEYVDKECVQYFGDYVLYSIENSRVKRCVEQALGLEAEEGDEEGEE